MTEPKLPKKISRFLRRNPDYEAAFAPDADLIDQVRTGRVHPYIVHHCGRETWAAFVETDDIAQFVAEHPRAIAASFDGVTVEPAQEH